MSLRKVVPAILLLLVAGLLLAQTSVPLKMLSGPVSPGGVLVLTPAGQITFASIGSGVALVQGAGGGYVLQVAAVNHVVGAKPARQADGSWLLAQPAVATSVRVYRNGVRQSAGDDYTFDSATRKIAAVAAAPWDAGDLVLVDYEFDH